MSKKLKKTLALILSLATVFSAAFTSMAETPAVEAEPVVVTELENDQVVPEEPVSVIADELDSAVSLEENISVETVEEVAETETGTDNEPEKSPMVSTGLLGASILELTTRDQEHYAGESVMLIAYLDVREELRVIFFDGDNYHEVSSEGRDVVTYTTFRLPAGKRTVGATVLDGGSEGEWKYLELDVHDPPTYTVTYDANGATSGTAPTDSNKYNPGTTVTVLGNTGSLAKTGYVFNGWNTKADGTGTHYDAGDPFVITSNTKLFAEWNKLCTITFYNCGVASKTPDPVQVAYGTTYKTPGSPGVPDKKIYEDKFGGWFYDAEFENAYDESIPIIEDITLYAKWPKKNEKSCRVTFETNGGEPVPKATNVSKGNKVSRPSPDPEKEGFIFGGWFKDSACTDVWDFNSDTVSAKITLYAKWENAAETKEVTFDWNHYQADPKAITKTEMVGEKYILPADSEKPEGITGFEFGGWFTDKTEGGRITEDTKVTKDGPTTLYAHWLSNVSYYAGEHIKSAKIRFGAQEAIEYTPDNDRYLFKNQMLPIGLEITTESVECDDGYECAGEGLPETFLVSTISFIERGIFAKEKAKKYTIADILPADFPKSKSEAWENENGKKSYVLENAIQIGNFRFPLSYELTSSGEDYVYIWDGDMSAFLFKMKDGRLQSIIVSGSTKNVSCNGEYKLRKADPQPDPKPTPSNDDDDNEPLYTGTWNSPVKNGSWTQDSHGIWHYASSETFRNTWGYILNPFAKEGQNAADWFWFDRHGNMLTGWQFINGKWYYLNPTKDGTLGACQLGGVTPDGWTVDESGAWIESIPRK